ANNYNALMHAYISVEHIRKVAKSYGVSVTEFFVGLIILAAKRSGGPGMKYKNLFRVFIPVNLRNMFPTVTLRNFVNYVRINYDLNQPEQELKIILDHVKESMKKEMDPDLMVNRIIGNVKIEQNFLLRMAPLLIKIPAMRSVYGVIGETLNSYDISNLGRVELPKQMMPYISHYQFTIAPSKDTPKAASVVSFGDVLCLSFISKIIDRDFEK